MDRLACVDVPALSLQLLLREHPDWSSFPAAIVDRDSPQGVVLSVNERAFRAGIRPGARYGEALSVAPTLRAGVISPATIEAGVDLIRKRLERFSPAIEPATEEPGVFWLDASGLELLYSTLEDWAAAVRTELARAGFRATVVVGFNRFATYAVARSLVGGVSVFDDLRQEQASMGRVPLERLGLAPKLREILDKLGIRTAGTFLRLPASGLLERFGPDAERLRRMAGNELWTPLAPRAAEEPLTDKTILDEPVSNVLVLLTIIQRMLAPLLDRLAREQRAVTALHILFVLDSRENLIETVRPATATLEAKILVELLQLRLHASRLTAGIIEIEIRAEAAPATREQLALFAAGSRRSLEAAARALARLRAELGEHAVVRARLREGHLPEAGYGWISWHGAIELRRAQPRNVARRTLVRRIHARPVPLPPRPQNERNDNWLLQGLDCGPVVSMSGPYIVSGGWWRSTVHREYHFVETRRGDLLWVYYDRRRRRWYLHGSVE